MLNRIHLTLSSMGDFTDQKQYSSIYASATNRKRQEFAGMGCLLVKGKKPQQGGGAYSVPPWRIGLIPSRSGSLSYQPRIVLRILRMANGRMEPDTDP